MNNNTQVLCALCGLSREKCATEALEGVRLDMLGILAPNFRDLQGNSHEPKHICFDCAKNLKYLFDFKSLCLENEEHVLNFMKDQTKSTINLLEVLQRKLTKDVYCVESNTDEICRICLKKTELEKASQLETVKDMLQHCLPEIDLTASTKTVFCEQCVTILEKYFKFLLQHNMKKELQECLTPSENVYTNSLFDSSTTDVNKEDNKCGIKTESVNDNIEFVGGIDTSITVEELHDDGDTGSNSQHAEESRNLAKDSQENSIWWRTCYFCDYSTTSSLKTHFINFHPELELKWQDLSDIEQDPNSSRFKSETFQFEMKPSFEIKEERFDAVSESSPNRTSDDVCFIESEHCRNSTNLYHNEFQPSGGGKTLVNGENGVCEAQHSFSSEIAQDPNSSTFKSESFQFEMKPNFEIKDEHLDAISKSSQNGTSDDVCLMESKHCIISSNLHHPELQLSGGSIMPPLGEKGVCEAQNSFSLGNQKTPYITSIVPLEIQKTIDNDDGSVWNKCPFCPYSTKLSLTSHIYNFHPDKIRQSCPYCEFESNCKKLFNKHLTEVHKVPVVSDRLFGCYFCAFRTKRKTVFQKHIETVHKLLKCPHCTKTIEKSSLKIHLASSHFVPEETWPSCPICPYRAFSFNSLKKHMLKNKHGDKQFLEQVLEKSLKQMSEKDKEAQKVMLPPVKSKVAENKTSTVNRKSRRNGTGEGERVSKKSKKTDDKLTPEDSWPQCHFCPIRLIDKSALSRHVNMKHLAKMTPCEETWPKCPQCPYKTESQLSLKAHIRTRHDTPVPKLECVVCAFRTAKPETLSEHMRFKHPDKIPEKTWPKCPHCPYRSKLSASLKAHMPIHGRSK